MTFPLDAYLARLSLAKPNASLSALRQVQNNQQKTIPFENIDPLRGIVPSLDPEDLFHKLVSEQRGGYCFELNGLFGEALRALGFAIQPVLARVRLGAPVGGPKAHLAWIVTLDGEEWLADTGFGGPGPRHPIRVVPGLVQTEEYESFRLVPDSATGDLVLERMEPKGWFALYSFDRAPVAASDIAAGNFLSAKWTGLSPFPDNLMMSIRTADGRVSVFNRTVTQVVGGGAATRRRLGTPDELGALMKADFALDLDSRSVREIWLRLEAREPGVAA
ncbi:MAG: arylamine N-acetyltransferase family protein [Gemmobacter sp.]